MRIAVIGGGFTGLTAAYALARGGHDVVVLERSPAFGGLAAGFELHGTSIELTYHHLFRTDAHITDLVEELGVGNRLEWLTSSMGVYRGGRIHPFTRPVDLLRFEPLSPLARLRVGLVVLYLQKQRRWRHFTRHTALGWMRRRAGAQATEVLWEPLLRGKFDRFYDSVSMAWLWARLHVRANSRDRGDPVEKLGYFNGGFNVVVRALVERLDELGVALVRSADVRSIASRADRVDVRVGEVDEAFDRVLATVPSYVFAALVGDDPAASDEYLAGLRSIEYLAAICLVFSSDQDLGDVYWTNIADDGAPFLVFVNHTKLTGTERYRGKHVYYVGSYVPHDHAYVSLSDDELLAIWYGYVGTLFPEFDRGLVAEERLTRFKNAQHVVEIDYERRIPDRRTPLRGVYLSNFSQIFPEDRGTNYAVRDGWAAAAMIEADVA